MLRDMHDQQVESLACASEARASMCSGESRRPVLFRLSVGRVKEIPQLERRARRLTVDSPFLGQIQPFGFNFAPRGWAMCQGQLLSIAQNTALFSLLGTMYGGNGQTTFGLPDLRGRSLVGMGQGPGLTNIDQGEVAGSESATLIITQMPAHTHTATATSTLQGAAEAGDKANPQGRMLASLPSLYYTPPQGGQTYVPMFNQGVLTTVTVAPAGNSQPIPIRNPYLGMNMCIATQGIFPSRN